MSMPRIDSLKPMLTNPGGDLAPEQVVGRDDFMERLWERLNGQSVLLNAERRIGKTQVIKKMTAKPPQAWKPIYRNLENVTTPDEFARHVYDDVQAHLGSGKRAINFVRDFFEKNETKLKAKGVEVSLAERSWQEMMESAMADLFTARSTAGERVVFFWDEVPFMLQNIMRGKDGIELTNTLLSYIRQLPDRFTGLRFVLTGSIGMHHIIDQLRKAKIPADPLNKHYKTTLEPLSQPWAEALAHALIRGEKLHFPDINAASRAIAESADGFPFYIHNIIARWKEELRTGGAPEIREFVKEQLVAAHDPWSLKHYRDRLMTYYPDPAESSLARKILETLALEGQDDDPPPPFEFRALQNTIASSTDETSLRLMLEKLENDHYLKRDTHGRYHFRFPLIRRWWRLHY